ncbi:ATP-binding cassette domain-containing protein [uncultured Selenomonas sp.]|uniref:ATP-binding cassette domain-containing protein n=1 Tax=uncultured Selenomonas sp. TaxID=159275 RepID=UPI0025F22E57|nr:ATP-binding cassette domain-containing protein [uncultured Selenomonas sp.]
MNISSFVRQTLITNRKALAALALLKAAAGGLTVLGASCTAHILATVIGGSFSMEKAVPFFTGLLFVVLGKSLLTIPARRVQNLWMLETEERIRRQVHTSLLARSPLALVPETGGELQGLACESVRRLDSAFDIVLPAFINLAVLLPLYLLVFAATDAWTALLSFITLPIAPFLLYLIGLVTKEQSAKEYRAMMRMGKTFAELLRAIPMMKLFCREREGRARVATASDRFRTAALHVLRTAFVSSFALELITTLSIALIAVSLGLRLVADQMAFEPAFFVLLLAPEFYAPLAAGGTAFHACMEAGEALKRILSFIDDMSQERSTTAPDRNNHTVALTFSNVTCAYPGRTAPAVHNLTFSVPRGQITALKGTSGAGKSTVFALALGFLTPTEGSIEFASPCSQESLNEPATHTSDAVHASDSHHASENDNDAVSSIAYVPQESHIFQGTLRENLSLGRSASDHTLMRALEAAGLRSLFERLPGGLNTQLGDGSRLLSNGERKRLGLARALVIPTELYLFDEVTAGLDEENERTVLRTIQKLRNASWRPGILIASHRKTTLDIADNVITIDGGTGIRSPQPSPQGKGDREAVEGVPCTQKQFVRLNSRGCEHESDVLHLARTGDLPSPANSSAVQAPLSTADAVPLSLWERLQSACAVRSFFGFLQKDIPKWIVNLAHLLRLLPLQSTLLALLSALLADASAVLLLGASAWLIATAAYHPHLYMLAVAITGVRASGIGRALFRYLDRYLSHRAVFTLLTRLRLAVYDLTCARLPERRPGPPSGTFSQMVTTGIDELRDFYLRALFPLVRIIVIVIITTMMVRQENEALTIIPMLCALLLAALAYLSHDDKNEDTAEARYRSTLLDVWDGRSEISAFAARPWFIERLNHHAKNITTTRQVTLRREAITDVIAEAVPSLAWILMFLVLTSHLTTAPTQADAVHLVVVVMVLQTLMVFVIPLTDILRNIRIAITTFDLLAETSDIQKALPLGDKQALGALAPRGRLCRLPLLSSVSETERVLRRRSLPATTTISSESVSVVPSPPLRGTSPTGRGLVTDPSVLSATSVSFSYATTSPLLANLSFSLRPSEKLLLLGESGAGKTTIFHLLTRLWEPDAGCFKLSGRPYNECTIHDVRSAFAAATQAGYVFSGSIRENFDRLLPDRTNELRRRALSIACCDEFIETLPQGTGTPLGENGAQLSGGQRQRLLVALAVGALLADPQKILLLDEPTTGLDQRTAQQLLQNLMDAFPLQAMVLILHDRELAARILARNDTRVITLPESSP